MTEFTEIVRIGEHIFGTSFSLPFNVGCIDISLVARIMLKINV